jgi:VWFA-related protein
MRRGIGIAAALSAVFGPPIAAQQPPAFRARTDLVEVDVVVHDKDGRFVDDLSLADFEVREDGTAQRLEQIYLRGASPSGTTARPSSSPSIEVQPAARHIFVFVFDDLHMTANGFKRSQAAAATLFEKQFRDGDIGGVAIGGRIAGSQLTTDRAELVKAVAGAKPALRGNARQAEEQTWPRLTAAEAVAIVVHNNESVRNAAIQRACVDDEAQCRIADVAVASKANQLSDEARAESTQSVQLLRTLMTGLERFDGPKTVVLASEGFMTEDSWPLVEDAVGLAARANARIYALDARGLNRGLTSLSGENPGGTDALTRLVAQMDFGADSTNSLAVDSGGFVVRNENDFSRAIARIGDDATHYYVVGYRSSLPQDGKFHRLRVVVNRPNVAVRARRGYVASPRSVATETATPPDSPAAPGVSRAPTEAAPEPAPPAAAAPAVESNDARVIGSTTAGSAPGVRMRPDAGKHVDLLLKSESADAAAKAGWDAFQRGDVASARESLGTAAEDPAAAAWVHYALGMTEYALGEYPQSARQWEHVRTAAPEFEPVYFDLVDSYLQLKDHDQALRVLRAAKERWPRDPDVFNALGVVQTVRGSVDDAIKSFQDAVAAAPADGVGYFNLGRALEMRFAKSRRYVQQLRKWVSNDADRAAALENYKRYLEIGGPYSKDAQAGIARLSWDIK